MIRTPTPVALDLSGRKRVILGLLTPVMMRSPLVVLTTWSAVLPSEWGAPLGQKRMTGGSAAKVEEEKRRRRAAARQAGSFMEAPWV